MHRLILGWLNCPEVAAPDMIGIAEEAGFDAVGLRIAGRRPGDGFPSIVNDAASIATMRSRAANAGVDIHNVSAYHIYPDIALSDLEPIIDAAAALGAPSLLVACYDDDHARFVERMAALADAAAVRNVRLFLEFAPFSSCKSLPAALAIVNAVNKANFGMIVDPLHLARSGGTPDDVRTIPRERLFFMQLSDAAKAPPAGVDLPTEARGMRLLPGEGDLCLTRLFELVPVDMDVECECPTQLNLRRSPVERAREIRAAALRFFAP